VELVLLLDFLLSFEAQFVAQVAFEAEAERDHGIADAVGGKGPTEVNRSQGLQPQRGLDVDKEEPK